VNIYPAQNSIDVGLTTVPAPELRLWDYLILLATLLHKYANFFLKLLL
jgi:hypothetical protein